MVQFVDLFCGIGGFRLGLEACNREQQKDTEVSGCGASVQSQVSKSNQPKKRGNYTCVWANDNDKYACQIYRRHWNDGTLHEGNLRTVDADSIPNHDLLCAGFPCQDFSVAGKRAGLEGARGTLFFEICRVLRAKRPSYVFLENVKGLLSADNGRAFGIVLTSLDELGYDCQWQVLNSKDFGVPQNRERVFIIGHLRGQPRPKVFPIGEDGSQNNSPEPEWFSYAIDSNYGKGCYTPGKSNARTMINFGALQGGAHSGGLHSQMTGLQNEIGIRRLTPLECERLQGFPDGWTEGISDTQRYKCLGNAVTVNVIEAIGGVILCQNSLEV